LSFDLFLQRFEAAASTETAAEAISAVLLEFGVTSPRGNGWFDLDTALGACGELQFDGPATGNGVLGCAFHLRGLSLRLLELIWRVARAGDFVIVVPQEPGPQIILTGEHQRAHLPADLEAGVAVARSPEHLGELISGGFDNWQAYRMQIDPAS
jgi:hypothetical protein